MVLSTIQSKFDIINNICKFDLSEHYDSTCKYCGKPFNKSYKTVKYCCDDCRRKAKQDQNAAYQRKRRKLMRTGRLISNENNYVGTNFLSQHRRPDDVLEHKMVLKEMQRVGLR